MSAALGPAVTASGPTELGAGGFGFILSPALPNNVDGVLTHYPGNVTKFFYRPNDYHSALTKYAKASNVMGVNAGHRFSTYKKTYSGANIPDSLRTKFGISPDAPLYPIRMPNLGRDITHMDSYIPILRKVHILSIFQQIVKLLGQVHRLQLSGYIHGDIRERNIMVTSDGTLTIIDFDLLNEKEDMIFVGMHGPSSYRLPPEIMLFVDEHELYDKILEYSESHIKYFPTYYSAVNMKERKIADKVMVTIKTSKDEYNQILKEKRSLLDTQETMLFPFFDSFGLSCTLLEFLTKLYGSSILKNELSDTGVAIFMGDLRGLRVQKGSIDYTDLELRECASKLLNLAQRVLAPMANLVRRERLVGNIGSILIQYPVADALLTDLTTRLAAPIASASTGATGGAGTGNTGLLRGFGLRGGLPAPSTIGLTRQAGTVFRPENLANLKFYAPKNNDGKARRTRRARRS